MLESIQQVRGCCAHKTMLTGDVAGHTGGSIMPTEQGGEVRELVLEIAKALVDEPDLVTVESIPGPESTVLELRVAQRDLGKVIGKQGRTARSLRTIIGAASMKLHKRHTLEIIEDGLPGSATATGA